MIVGVLQARVSSTRLPGKVLEPVLGRPMIARQIERLLGASCLDRLVVATTLDASDDVLAALCENLGVDCHRGSMDDVLDRFHGALERSGAEHCVRLTADCPLTDPGLIDAVVRFHLEGGYDYSSNCLRPSYPDGLDAEVMRAEVLERAWREARMPSEREHVTRYIVKRPEMFSIGSMEYGEDLSGLRWTVDEGEDLEFVRRVYAELYPRDPAFGWRDVVELLNRHPELSAINRGFRRNEGLARSEARDAGSTKAEGSSDV